MRSLIIILAALTLASAANATPNCTKGVPCGNACIAKGKVCHVGQAAGAATQGGQAAAQGAAAAPAMAASATSAGANATATAGKAAPTCKPGKTKLCGKACIPVSKTCHA
jgi:type IV secretory pathway TrbL component